MEDFPQIPSDLIRILALELDLSNLNSYCQLSKRFTKVIQNDIVWMVKFFHDFGKIDKPDLTWKQFYQKVVTTKPSDLLREGARENQLSLVKASLARGADIHADHDYSLTMASHGGYLEIVKYLVEQGAAFNNEAIRMASLNGHLEVVKYLVKNGSDIHAVDDYALRMASKYGHLEVVKYLVEQGADIHARDEEALRMAKKYEHLEVVKYLESLP